MINVLYRFLFFCITILVVCCTGTTSTTSKETTDGKISISQFNELLANTSTPQLLDVRTPAEFKRGHLPNAINIDFKADNFVESIQTLDRSQPIFIYCHSGGRSGKAYKKMKALGFTTVYDMEGGYKGYSERVNAK